MFHPIRLEQISMYEYKCRIDRVVDGDTADAMIDLGFDTWVKKNSKY